MIHGAGMSDWVEGASARQKRVTQAIHGYLTSAASSHFRHQEVTILDQWQGRDNLLWRVRGSDGSDAVVKLFTDAGQARSRRQFSGQEQFAAAGLAPEPLWHDRYPQGLPCQILIYRWVEGEALQLTDPRQQTALAETVAHIHRADGGAVRRFSPRPFNLLTFWQIWQAGEAQLQTWLSRMSAPLLTELFSNLWAAAHRMLATALPLFGETPPTAVHGDLAVENGLFRSGRALLVDWEFFGLGDPAQEIARFLFYSGDAWPQGRQEELNAPLLGRGACWWEAYRSGNADPSLSHRVELYMRLFNFQAATFLLEGIRQGAIASPSATASVADDRTTQYRSFLIDALTVAVRRSLDMWGLPPLGKADGLLLGDELEHIMNFHLAESRASDPAGN